jgi:poly(beta-D-mannuronate) lyase
VADSIRITGCRFEGVKGPVFRFEEETDAKGYYNVETMRIEGCVFSDCTGPILSMLRSGKDESTMGPQVLFTQNHLRNCRSASETALISLKGVQVSRIDGNTFTACNPGQTLIEYHDWVKAAHVFKDNRMQQSGFVRTNAYVSLR